MLDRSKVREIYAIAAALPPAERDAYINSACGSDQTLRTEVLSLLAAADKEPDFMAAPTRGGTSALPAETLGARIGPYKLLEEIGHGGFGTVYLAEQDHPVRRRVALKIIKLGMDTRAVVARFEAERQALAMMDHAHIAKVFDAGITEPQHGSRPYFVMELVRGEPITAYADHAGLTIPERLDLFFQVCQAIQHAHSKGIIHRDIKPGNVLVSTQDGRPHAKVIDFGIAKAIQQRLTEKTLFTEFRQLVGTPEYMSPEQAGGAPDVDTRSDVYSLGVLLYELLTGATPFDSSDLRAAAYDEIQRIIREVEPPKPSTRLSRLATLANIATLRRTEPARLNALITGDLDWIVMKALDKDRARRYETASALAADLARHLCGEPVNAAPPGRAYRIRKFVSRHRVAAGVVSLLWLVLVLGVTGTSIGLLKARTARADAVDNAAKANANAEKAANEAARADAQAQQARAHARVADAVNELMKSMIGRADRAKEQGRSDVTVREVMDAAAADLEAGVATPEPQVAAMLAKTIGATYSELSLLDPAERMLRLHHRLTTELFGPDGLEHASSAQTLGEILRKRGNTAEARSLFARAREVATRLGRDGTDLVASSLVSDAAIDAKEGRADKAEADLRTVLSMLEQNGLGGSPTAITATNNLASILWSSGKRSEAQDVYARSLDLLRKRGDQPDLADMLGHLAAIQHSQRDFVGAEKTSEEEVALVRRLYGDRHLKLARSLDTYSMILMARDKPLDAIAAGREVVAIRRALLRPDHESLATSLRKLGGVMIDSGQFIEAEPILREACETAARTTPASDPDFVFARYQHAVALSHKGDIAEAEAILRRVLADSEESMKDGSRLWWMRGASACLLAGVLSNAAVMSVDPADQRSRIDEAAVLIDTFALRLLGHKEGLGPRARRAVVGRSLDQVVAACEIAARLAPDANRPATLQAWRDRRDQFRIEVGM